MRVFVTYYLKSSVWRASDHRVASLFAENGRASFRKMAGQFLDGVLEPVDMQLKAS